MFVILHPTRSLPSNSEKMREKVRRRRKEGKRKNTGEGEKTKCEQKKKFLVFGERKEERERKRVLLD